MTTEQASIAERSDRRRSVLVLDSGIGGITVVRAIRELSPGTAVTYVSDNGLFPYGGRDPGELTQRLKTLVGQGLDHLDIEAVVIACNTASTVVLDELRKAFPVPFVGVVPPIKTAGAISRTRVIGLLATEGTVRGSYVDDLIRAFAADCRVAKVACPELVDLAEDKARARPVDRRRLRAALAPLMAPEFAELVRVLHEAPPRADRRPEGTASDVVFFTAEHDLPDDLRPFLVEMGFDRLEHWPRGVTGRAASA